MALENFYRDKDEPCEQTKILDGPLLHTYSMTDGFAATRILLSKRLKNKLIAIPGRDMLVSIEYTDTHSAISFMSAMANFSDAPYRISPNVYVYENEKLVDFMQTERGFKAGLELLEARIGQMGGRSRR